MSDELVETLAMPVRLTYEIRAGQQTSRFLRALCERQILGRRSAETGRVYVPPKGVCPVTGGLTNEDVWLPDTGTVTSFCVVNFRFEGQVLDPPYAAVCVVLDGADVPLFHLVGEVDVDHVHVGMRVKARWDSQPAPTLESIRFFVPSELEDDGEGGRER